MAESIRNTVIATLPSSLADLKQNDVRCKSSSESNVLLAVHGLPLIQATARVGRKTALPQ